MMDKSFCREKMFGLQFIKINNTAHVESIFSFHTKNIRYSYLYDKNLNIVKNILENKYFFRTA